MKDFHKYEVWQISHQLAVAIYHATIAFPKEEVYGLTSQMRRASSSIPANIAEGCGRDTIGDFARFLQIAAGSASELEYHLVYARDVGLLSAENYDPLNEEVNRVKRMLNSLIQKLKASNQQPTTNHQKPITKG